MLKTESRPLTTGQYQILSLPTKRRTDAPKCSRKGCTDSRMPGSIWCSEHLNCSPGTSCDNIPAIAK
jgi:hypothetical protein